MTVHEVSIHIKRTNPAAELPAAGFTYVLKQPKSLISSNVINFSKEQKS